VNTFGPVYVAQAFLPLLRAGPGRLINISTPTARVAMPFMAPIGASKAAVASPSDALRLELAAWNIPVIVVESGGTQTDTFTKADVQARTTLAPKGLLEVTISPVGGDPIGRGAPERAPRPRVHQGQPLLQLGVEVIRRGELSAGQERGLQIVVRSLDQSLWPRDRPACRRSPSPPACRETPGTRGSVRPSRPASGRSRLHRP
jgi:NAD(P)-dependent dehydrogenase (short-subunit alcohol dehydrogenase family)